MNITHLKQIGSAFGYIAINPLSLIIKKGSVIMPFPQERIYTIADIYNLPEGIRAELVDGQIYYMEPPTRTHQKISGFLHATIYNNIRSNNGKCEVYAAPFAVFLNRDDMNYFEPDISVICDPDKLDNRGCNGAPDWIVEIVSTSTSSHDYITKLSKYKAAGVREYWIVNPLRQIITVYLFNEKDIFPQTYGFKDKIGVSIFNDLVIDICELDICELDI